MRTVSACVLLTLGLAVQGRGPPPSSVTTEAATTEAATTTEADDEYITAAKALIDAGTCDSVAANSNCGTAATSYFATFEYDGYTVVVSSGVPDHVAETDAVSANPNTRCEIWQFMKMVTDNTQDEAVSTDMGATGLAVTGGHFYNHLSSPFGDIALYNEGESLDSCFGHSDADGTYHYHANINCTDAGAATGANDPDECVLIGYMKDGIPLYGLCNDATGEQFNSCYALVSGAATADLTLADGATYTVASMDTDYEYDSSAEGCNLDLANGAVHPTTGQYSYFATTGYPYLPIYYYGSGGAADSCALGY